ncbi:MAG TPA: hypothetical protein VLF94_01385 [Chlamydiales bacterium]|nr:hypothetical protein [Chlamydiales bacterium]
MFPAKRKRNLENIFNLSFEFSVYTQSDSRIGLWAGSKRNIFNPMYIKTCIFLCFIQLSYATVFTVNVNTDSNLSTGSGTVTTGDLRYCINQINQTATGTHSIVFAIPIQNTITLAGILPLLNLNGANHLTINGVNTSTSNNITVNGTNTYPGFFARQGTISLQNMTLANCNATGGTGGKPGGGGGMGAGGALFIDSATVTLSNVNFSNNSSIGGGGGAAGTGNTLGGGGGGLYKGAGGESFAPSGSGFSSGAGGGGIGSIGGSSGHLDTGTSSTSFAGCGGGGALECRVEITLLGERDTSVPPVQETRAPL